VLDTCTVGIPKGDIRQVQQAGLFVGREGRNQIAGLTRFMDKPQLRIAVHIQFNEWQQCYVQVTEVLISAEFNAPSVMFISFLGTLSHAHSSRYRLQVRTGSFHRFVKPH
jgi:hypothetical protein